MMKGLIPTRSEGRPPQDRRAGRGGAAQGIMLALLLSAPVWFGIGVAIWQASLPATAESPVAPGPRATPPG